MNQFETEQRVIDEYRRVLNDNPPLKAMSYLSSEERVRKMREAMAIGLPLTTYDFIPKGAVT